MKQKCPGCGLEFHEGIELNDLDHCLAWAHLYSTNRGLPTKQQFEAMQRQGFLPTHKKYDERYGKSLEGKEFELNYGHYGWAVDYNWKEIARKISEARIIQPT